LYWNGTNFVEFEYGKSKVIEDVDTWQGYNWDTATWVNRPPSPPDVICDNKVCGWIGSSDDRVRDENYDDHCPECNGTDFSWIDYDPETAKGRKNREKFCREWDPVAALDKIVESMPDDIATKAKWPF
jgi:hypothetical protein